MLAGTQHSLAYKCLVTEGAVWWHSQANSPLQTGEMHDVLHSGVHTTLPMSQSRI